MEFIGPDEILCIFKYLSPKSLIRAGRVCKEWNLLSKSNTLWLYHCLRQWSFCKLCSISPEPDVWYKFYSARIRIDVKLKEGRPGLDYKVKSIRHHKSNIIGVIYVSSPQSYISNLSNGIVPEPVICSWDALNLSAWKITNGSKLWSVDLEEDNRRKVFYDEVNHHLLVTCPKGKIISVDMISGQEVNRLCTSAEDSEITAVATKKLLVSQGLKGRHVPIKYLFVGLQTGKCHVWEMHDLTAPKYTFYSFSGVSSIAISDNGLIATASSTFDEVKVHNIKEFGEKGDDNVNFWNFSVRGHVGNDNDDVIFGMPPHPRLDHLHPTYVKKLFWLGTGKKFLVVQTYDSLLMYDAGVKGQLPENTIQSVQTAMGFKNMLLTGTANGNLNVYEYENDGRKLHSRSFTDHQGAVKGIYADPYRVVTCSTDLSIRVYNWSSEKRGPLPLISLYQLLGGSLQYNAEGFQGIVCDYGSCVAWTNKIIKCYLFT